MATGRSLIVVGFGSVAESAGALDHAVALTTSQPDVSLVVVHSAEIPVSIQNGPTATIAAQLGNPDWATVHPSVLESGAPTDRTTTVVGSAGPVDLISRYAKEARLVLLGPRRKRLFGRQDTQRSLQALVDCPVIRIPQSGLVEDALDIDVDAAEESSCAPMPNLRQAA